MRTHLLKYTCSCVQREDLSPREAIERAQMIQVLWHRAMACSVHAIVGGLPKRRLIGQHKSLFVEKQWTEQSNRDRCFLGQEARGSGEPMLPPLSSRITCEHASSICSLSHSLACSSNSCRGDQSIRVDTCGFPRSWQPRDKMFCLQVVSCRR